MILPVLKLEPAPGAFGARHGVRIPPTYHLDRRGHRTTPLWAGMATSIIPQACMEWTDSDMSCSWHACIPNYCGGVMFLFRGLALCLLPNFCLLPNRSPFFFYPNLVFSNSGSGQTPPICVGHSILPYPGQTPPHYRNLADNLPCSNYPPRQRQTGGERAVGLGVRLGREACAQAATYLTTHPTAGCSQHETLPTVVA